MGGIAIISGIAAIAAFTLSATPSSSNPQETALFKCSPTQTTQEVGGKLIPVDVLATKVSLAEGKTEPLQTLIRWIPEYLPQGTDIQTLCSLASNKLQ
ncbi:MAG: hypothetical protein GDA44_09860 [Prochloron sp. SP5CPC1]|nr:hypothetical protein [Candidatus Paraprochloron terpiosi SP5CPC1]